MVEDKQGLVVFVVSISLRLTHKEIQGWLKTGNPLQPTVGAKSEA